MNVYEQILGTAEASEKSICSDACFSRLVADVLACSEAYLSENVDKTDFDFIDCKKGCAHCCVVYITVLMPEAVNIADFLRREGRAEGLIPLLEERVKETRWTDEQDWSLLGKKCIFLDQDGACSIYPVRPLLCRAVTSVSAEDCHEALAARIMGEETPVLMNIAVKKTYEQGFRAMADLLKAHGMDNAGLELTRAVLCALKNSGLAERLKKGEKIRPFC
ncbi:MAG: YkgJ family cysteine cluster protein [Deferribacterales bacterium]